MTAWPQIERCMVQQWKGYDPMVRDLMTKEFRLRGGAPGVVGNSGHHLFVIWRVEHDGAHAHTCQDLLMSIKVDFGPPVDSDKLTVVG